MAFGGPDSSVGIATRYGLYCLGIESRWGTDFPHLQTCPGGHPASCTMGTGSIPVLNGRGVMLIPHRIFSAEILKRVELYLYLP